MSEPLTARTIRLYSDGELPQEQARQVEHQLQQDPQLKAWVEFERRLKEHVGLVMRADGSPVPAGVAEHVRAAGEREATAVVGRVEVQPQAATTSRAWWRAPSRANFFAVAACLVLVVGAVLFGILGPSIDNLRVRNLTGVAAGAAAAVAGEHVMTTSMLPTVKANARFRTPDEARRALASLFGVSPDFFDLSELGYTFVAGDLCAVPHCEQGCHLLFERSEGKPGLVSLHVVPDRGQFAIGDSPYPGPMPLGTDVIPEGSGCKKDVLMWSHEGRSYLLVVCVDDDVRPVATRMQEALIGRGLSPRR